MTVQVRANACYNGYMLTVHYRKLPAIERDPLAVKAACGVDPNDYTQVAKLEGDDLNVCFREMNVVEGDEIPVGLGIRSMMTGDVVVKEDGSAWLCAMVGWKQVEWK